MTAKAFSEGRAVALGTTPGTMDADKTVVRTRECNLYLAITLKA